LGRKVGVKILRDDLVDSPVFLERFRAEARHTAGLAHPGIASVFDYGEDRNGDQLVAYLVMELVDGKPLSKLMAEQGPLPVGMVLSVLAQAAEALSAAHAMGVVHRDVKPGNLLVLDNGTVKVTDFGIARAANSAALTEVGQVIGTARYISPEQATGGEATPASDVYSLGVVGYEMLAGTPPFTADNAGAIAMAHVHRPPPPLPASVPAGVSAAIAGALSKDPAGRPADARAFASELRRLQLGILPPPGAHEHDEEQTIPATQLMGTETVSRTAIMPPAMVVERAGDLGVSDAPLAARRQRRRIGIAVLASAVALFVVVQLGMANDGVPSVVTTTSIGTSTPAPPATTVVADVQTPTTVPIPTTLPPGHGKKNDKPPKDKPHP
jgi:serine/threonine-protein kinase